MFFVVSRKVEKEDSRVEVPRLHLHQDNTVIRSGNHSGVFCIQCGAKVPQNAL